MKDTSSYVERLLSPDPCTQVNLLGPTPWVLCPSTFSTRPKNYPSSKFFWVQYIVRNSDDHRTWWYSWFGEPKHQFVPNNHLVSTPVYIRRFSLILGTFTLSRLSLVESTVVALYRLSSILIPSSVLDRDTLSYYTTSVSFVPILYQVREGW